MRPALGTFAEIVLDHTDSSSFSEARIFQKYFSLLLGWEKQLSFFDASSELCRFNAAPIDEWIPVSESFYYLTEKCREISDLSQAGFWPFRESPPESAFPIEANEEDKIPRLRKLRECKLDFGGIAKGFAIDQVLEGLATEPDLLGASVNIGGDLRRFGSLRSNSISVVSRAHQWSQKIQTQQNAIASSEPAALASMQNSSTIYFQESKSIATVTHSSCAIADALTKVALFSPLKIVETVMHHFQAGVLLSSTVKKQTVAIGFL